MNTYLTKNKDFWLVGQTIHFFSNIINRLVIGRQYKTLLYFHFSFESNFFNKDDKQKIQFSTTEANQDAIELLDENKGPL